jgi:hypothetical protein
VPPPPRPEDDPRERLIAKLDRLAARIPREERRANLLAELAKLDAEPAGREPDEAGAGSLKPDEAINDEEPRPEPSAPAGVVLRETLAEN